MARLRATSFGTVEAPPGLIESSTAILAEHLALGDYACFVVETDGLVVSFGVAMIHQRLPAAHNSSGRWGWVQSMETHPDHRHQGHATAILQAIQSWYRAQRIPSAMLVATEDGASLYRREGFIDEPFGQPLIWFDGAASP